MKNVVSSLAIRSFNFIVLWISSYSKRRSLKLWKHVSISVGLRTLLLQSLHALSVPLGPQGVPPFPPPLPQKEE